MEIEDNKGKSGLVDCRNLRTGTRTSAPRPTGRYLQRDGKGERSGLVVRQDPHERRKGRLTVVRQKPRTAREQCTIGKSGLVVCRDLNPGPKTAAALPIRYYL